MSTTYGYIRPPPFDSFDEFINWWTDCARSLVLESSNQGISDAHADVWFALNCE